MVDKTTNVGGRNNFYFINLSSSYFFVVHKSFVVADRKFVLRFISIFISWLAGKSLKNHISHGMQ
jgi:hypothetical protein